jgi:hypothetical protein
LGILLRRHEAEIILVVMAHFAAVIQQIHPFLLKLSLLNILLQIPELSSRGLCSGTLQNSRPCFSPYKIIDPKAKA